MILHWQYRCSLQGDPRRTVLVGKFPLNLYIFSYSQMVCWKATWQITSTDSIPSKDMGMPFPQKFWHWYTIANMFLQGLREHDMCYNIFNSQIMFRNFIPRLVKGIAYYYKCSPTHPLGTYQNLSYTECHLILP